VFLSVETYSQSYINSCFTSNTAKLLRLGYGYVTEYHVSYNCLELNSRFFLEIGMNLPSNAVITQAYIYCFYYDPVERCGGNLRIYSYNNSINPMDGWVPYNMYYGAWNSVSTELSDPQHALYFQNCYNNTYYGMEFNMNSTGINYLNQYKTSSAFVSIACENDINNTGVPAGWGLSPSSFKIIYYLPPSAPALNSPTNNASIYTTSVNFSWSAPSQGATSYTLQVSKYSDFSSFVYNNTVSTTSQTVSGLEYGMTYYWRVNATNPAGTSSWSEVRSFNIVSLSKNNRPILQTIMQTR